MPQVARATQGTVQYKTQYYIKKSNKQNVLINKKINMHIKSVISVCHKIPRKSIWGFNKRNGELQYGNIYFKVQETYHLI